MNQKKITRRDKNFTATGRGTLYIYEGVIPHFATGGSPGTLVRRC